MDFNLKVNASKWKLRQYRNFLYAVKSGDFDTILESVTTIIESWSLVGSPQDVDYWLDELKLDQWQAIMAQVNDALVAEFNNPKK